MTAAGEEHQRQYIVQFSGVQAAARAMYGVFRLSHTGRSREGGRFWRSEGIPRLFAKSEFRRNMRRNHDAVEVFVKEHSAS